MYGRERVKLGAACRPSYRRPGQEAGPWYPCAALAWPTLTTTTPHPQVKRHIKATKETPAGSLSLEGPIHYSNVALVDPQTHAPVRVRWRYTDQGERVSSISGLGIERCA